jgi:hypothetical protein
VQYDTQTVPYDTRLDSIIGYFDPTILAVYRAEPDKYDVKTDFFEGEVRITTTYYESLPESDRDAAYIGVKFGFRTLANGALALAAYLPDLVDRSEGQVPRWRGFLLQQPAWSDYDEDERFQSWVRRYFEGNWDVDNGPAHYIPEEIRLINGLAKEAVGKPLFALEHEPHISFPSAQNSHRYEDAHLDLYRIIHDGLDKHCIEELGRRIVRPVNVRSMQTLAGLKALLPSLAANTAFSVPLEHVAEERRKASHKQRPPAVPFRAFEAFTTDLTDCVTALRVLRGVLEEELGMNAKKSTRRQDALSRLPRIEGRAEANYSINGAAAMVGKTVAKVEYGFRHHIAGVHQSEVLIIHFADGSIMSLDTGCNAGNVLPDRNAESFHVDFHVHWVPPPETAQEN